MESKKMAMLMVIVTIMGGSLLDKTNAQSSQFSVCYSDCLVVCKSHTTFPRSVLCPFTCLTTCLVPTSPSPSPSPSPSSDNVPKNKIGNTEYFCKLGCATHHCVSLSSFQNLNVENVANCVDSCSDMCS